MTFKGQGHPRCAEMPRFDTAHMISCYRPIVNILSYSFPYVTIGRKSQNLRTLPV